MKKNKKLDKIVAQALDSSFKGDKIDQNQVSNFVKNFKKLSLEEAIYALTTFKKGLQQFEDKHTLTVYAPVELPKETLIKIKNSTNSKLEIRNLKFEMAPSLLAGFKFKIGDTIFDSSLRSSLESLKS